MARFVLLDGTILGVTFGTRGFVTFEMSLSSVLTVGVAIEAREGRGGPRRFFVLAHSAFRGEEYAFANDD